MNTRMWVIFDHVMFDNVLHENTLNNCTFLVDIITSTKHLTHHGNVTYINGYFIIIKQLLKFVSMVDTFMLTLVFGQ